MGVIIRQGLKHSIVTFISTLVGMISLIFIYTHFLKQTELGFFKYFLSTAQLIFPFILFGFGSVAIRFYSDFKTQSLRKNGFLFFLLAGPFLLFCIFLIGCFIFRDTFLQIIEHHDNKDLIIKNFPAIPFLIFAMLYNQLLTQYISNFKRIVVPEILNNLWLKIIAPLLAISCFLGYISFSNFIIGVVMAYFVTTFGLFFYLWKLGKLDLRPNFKLFSKNKFTLILNFAFFSVLSIASSLIATQIDTFMVGSLINADNAAIYVIALSIATVIGIPYRSINSIVSPIISESWVKNDTQNIHKLYRKSSLNLLIIGLLLLVLIWASVDFLFEIIPNGEVYALGKNIILILGLAKLVDMATSINYSIIIYSKYYRYNLYFGIVLAVLNIIFNVVFINLFGLIGVAIATLTSMTLFNLMKLIFVWFKFKMQPFSKEMMIVVIIGVLTYFITFLLPRFDSPFIDIIFNSLVIFLVYIPPILIFNLSPDFTMMSKKFLNKIL